MYERLLGAEGLAAPAFQLVRGADADTAASSSSSALADQEPALAPLLGCFDSVSIAAADQCVIFSTPPALIRTAPPSCHQWALRLTGLA